MTWRPHLQYLFFHFREISEDEMEHEHLERERIKSVPVETQFAAPSAIFPGQPATMQARQQNATAAAAAATTTLLSVLPTSHPATHNSGTPAGPASSGLPSFQHEARVSLPPYTSIAGNLQQRALLRAATIYASAYHDLTTGASPLYFQTGV